MQAESALISACGGFLLAVAYYRRVTTTAHPMGHLVGAVMATLVVTLIVQIALGHGPRWLALASLLLCAGPILLAFLRVVPNAVRLGARSDTVLRQSELARSICTGHLLCFSGMLGFLILRLSTPSA